VKEGEAMEGSVVGNPREGRSGATNFHYITRDKKRRKNSKKTRRRKNRELKRLLL